MRPTCVCSCDVNSIIMLFEGREAVRDSRIDKLMRRLLQKDRSVSRVVLLHPEHNTELMDPSLNLLGGSGGRTDCRGPEKKQVPQRFRGQQHVVTQ